MERNPFPLIVLLDFLKLKEEREKGLNKFWIESQDGRLLSTIFSICEKTMLRQISPRLSSLNSENFFSEIIRRVLGASCLVQFNKYFPVVSLLYGFLAASRLFYHNNHFIIARSQRSPEVMLFWTNETNFLSF